MNGGAAFRLARGRRECGLIVFCIYRLLYNNEVFVHILLGFCIKFEGNKIKKYFFLTLKQFLTENVMKFEKK